MSDKTNEAVTYMLRAPGCVTGPTESMFETAIKRARESYPAGTEVVPLVPRDAPVTITEAMVEAGARAMNFVALEPVSPEFQQWFETYAKDQARACLEAALAVRDQEQ